MLYPQPPAERVRVHTRRRRTMLTRTQTLGAAPSTRVSTTPRRRTRAAPVVSAARGDVYAFAPARDASETVQTVQATLLPGVALPPAQAVAFNTGLILGIPWALMKIARDIRAQNIAERRRASLAPVKSRISAALDGRRAGRERAAKIVPPTPRERRAAANTTDVPIFSNVKREVNIKPRGSAPAEPRAPARPQPARAPAPTPTRRATAPVAVKKGPVVKVTLAVQCSLPEGVILGVVGDDEALRAPLALRRVGADRWQVVADIGSGELRYSYVAMRGDKIVREEGPERLQRISSAGGPPLIIEKNAPRFK
mmetsp:Transcript_6277/g.21201  ORF Transcript_6277/g.21201 Transcript_6277/m.21201 type:complete len:311 (-) Transcript_6277:2202-3134(-)